MPQWEKLSKRLVDFIEQQPLFFVATAGEQGRVNLSPKGMDSLKVIDQNHIVWLNVSGSGNETAAHIKESSRMTLMFCAFDGEPMILRVYGSASVLHPRDPGWEDAASGFPEYAGSRQIFNLSIELVQTSCGTGVPLMPFKKSRGEEELLPFFADMGKEGVKKYWTKKNSISIDGKSTGINE